MSGSEKLIDGQRAGAVFRESEEHYRAVADVAMDAIITIDLDSTILIVNSAPERLFGYSNEELIGQPLTMLMPEYLRHVHKAGITRYPETGRKHIHWSAIQLRGLHKWLGPRPFPPVQLLFLKDPLRKKPVRKKPVRKKPG